MESHLKCLSAVSTSISLVLSSLVSVLLFSVLQIYKPLLSSTQSATILGGFIGSWLFVFSLTAVSNLESLLLGPRKAIGLFPEVVVCLLVSAVASGMVHRVCITTWCVILALRWQIICYVDRLSPSSFQYHLLFDRPLLPQPSLTEYLRPARTHGGADEEEEKVERARNWSESVNLWTLKALFSCQSFITVQSPSPVPFSTRSSSCVTLKGS